MVELNFENIDLGSFGINEEEVEQPLKSTMSEAVKINPDEQAQIKKLSVQSGIPSFAVQNDKQPVEDQLKLEQIDFDTLSMESPTTSDYLTNFENASIAHDDIDNLSGIESVFNFRNTFKNIGGSITQSFKNQLLGLGAVAIDAAPTKIEDLIPMTALPIGMRNEAFGISKDFAAGFGIESDEDLTQAKDEAVNRMLVRLRESQSIASKLQPEDLNILEQGVRGGVESLANMAPGFGLMLLSGGAALPLLTTIGIQTFGGSYAEGRAEGLSQEKATWFATIDAAVEVGTELIPIRTLENFITGGVKGLGKKALKFAIQEMGTEQLATLGQSLNKYIFGLDEQIENATTVEEIINIQMQRQAVTAIATVVAGGAQIGIATGITKTMGALQTDEEVKQRDQAADQQSIDRLNDQSEKSKLKQRDKESFKQFVGKADGDSNTTLFIDAAQTSLYLQEKTQEEIDADPALTLLNEQVREAAAIGGEVQIPVADFAGDLAGTDHFTVLRDSMTMSEETISPFRQEQAQVETQNYVKRMLDTAQENISEYAEAQDIYQTVRQQLIDSGRVTPQNASVMANIVPAWATAKAVRENKPVQQIYEESGLIIEGPLTGEKARLEGEIDVLTQGVDYDGGGQIVQNENFQNWFGDSKVVDDQGEPLVVYRGSPVSLPTVFEHDIDDENRQHEAFFFTSSKDVADVYASDPAELYEEKDTVNEVADFYLNANNLYDLRMLKDADIKQVTGKEFSERSGIPIDEYYDNVEMYIHEFWNKLPEVGEYIRENGYNGFVFNEFGVDNYAVFNSTQIKSVDNRGTFDPVDPNIFRQEIDTTSENFQNWFDDSKVVDEDGDPLVVFHGTDAEFSEFKESKNGQAGRGIYLSPYSGDASQYGNNVINAYVSLKNPRIIERKDIPFDTKSFRVNTEGLGFDGVIITDASGNFDEIVAFEPTQIKSTENVGTFDPANPNIFRQPTSDDLDGTRGYYDPTNSLIRMTETSNLSTFLHEFGHFMLDMEGKGNTDMYQSINNWYKRDAAVVAKEANTYLDKDKYDAEKQDITFEQDVDTTSENFKNWFGDSQVVDENGDPLVLWRGDTEQVSTFDEDRLATGTQQLGGGFYFVENQKDAVEYGSAAIVDGKVIRNVNPFYMKMDNPYVVDAEGRNIRAMQPEASDYARANGFDGVILQNVIDARGFVIDDTPKTEYIVFNSTQIKSTENVGTFDPADPNVFRQPTLPVQPGAGGKVSDSDVIAYIDTGSTGSKSKDAAINRAIHEQFARGFETYLMEGKAPSIELKNAFATIARWLTQIYTVIRGDLNAKLDAEMRQLYDRLLATDEQIAAAVARNRFEPMFTSAAMAGMTEKEFEAYKKKQEKVKDKQTETLRDKLIKQITRQTKKWWKEEKADVIIEETEELKTEKVYVATTRLKAPGEVKLDFAATKDLIGEQKIDKRGRKSIRISQKLRGMTAKEHQGIHPDQAAAMFGYASGAEMLHDIVNSPSIKVAADISAEAIMVERHGNIMTDGTIERAADDAVKNEERGKLILQELKALSKGTAIPTIDRITIKAIAKEKIGQLSFREIFPGKYRKAEIKASQEAAVSLEAGDKQNAAAAKMRQVMNYYLGLEASEAKAGTMKIVDRMSRYNKKKVREEIIKAENGYWDQLDKILNRFEFRKSVSLKAVESINTWMRTQIEEEGAGIVLSNAVLDEGYVTHWKNVPYNALQGVNDSVKNIEYVARYSNQIDILQEKVDFKKVVKEWVDSMNKKVESKFTPTASVADDSAKWRKWARWSMAQMTKIPFMASWLDGGERVGMSHQILVQRFTDAYDAEVRLWDETAKPVMDLILNRSKEDVKRHNTKFFIPEIAGTAFHTGNMMGHEIVAVALNTGNESNLRKLLLGEGWANIENEAEISFQNPKLQAVLAKLTVSDWQLVQKIWDQMDMLYPALSEVHRKTTGLTPPKIDKTPVEVQGLTLGGGYYPMKYDPSRDNRAQENEDKLNAQTESMFFNTASIQASVNTGATNERTKYYAPVRLSLDVVQNHFQETIHYITHHDAVRQVNKLIRDNSVTNTIKEKLGPDEYAQLKPWLNDIAKDGREAPVKIWWEDVFQKLRFGITLGIMGFKASTGIIQIAGLSNTFAEMGTASTLQALRSIIGSPKNMAGAWDFANENSKVMNHRVKTMDREIKNAMSKLQDKKGLKAASQEASMKHIALIQTYMVDLPTWHAGYIAEMKRTGDEQKAYQYADWAIENIQGSGITKDMAAIMRTKNEGNKMLTMFMTYFSSLWNLERDFARGIKSGNYSITTFAAKTAFLFVIPVLFEMIMRGELGGDKEPEEKLQKILTGVALYPIQAVPFVRDMASFAIGEYGYNFSPTAALLEKGSAGTKGLVKGIFTDAEITKWQVKNASKIGAAAAGVPGINQAWATGEHLYEVLEEGEEFTFHQLIFGPRRD